MNTLLVFFAIPLATIILSAILETFIDNPIKVAGIFFSIFIVVAFALGGTAELILLALIYTIISFLTALIVHIITHKHICNNMETISMETGYTDACSNFNNVSNTTQTEENTLTTNNNLYNNSRSIRNR